MEIGAWNRSTQLQFVTFKILAYKIFEQKQYKNMLSSSEKKIKKKKSKQFNLYGNLTKAKFKFESNQIFSKHWLYIYIYMISFLTIYVY